jgi:hypothetical protein
MKKFIALKLDPKVPSGMYYVGTIREIFEIINVKDPDLPKLKIKSTTVNIPGLEKEFSDYGEKIVRLVNDSDEWIIIKVDDDS